MKVEFEKGDAKYFYIAVAIIGLIVLSAFQWRRTVGLKIKIKDNDVEIKLLKEERKSLLTSVEMMEQEKNSLLKRADSFEVKERYYKNRYYVTNEKLKKILGDYNSSNPSDKNKLFTDAINN